MKILTLLIAILFTAIIMLDLALNILKIEKIVKPSYHLLSFCSKQSFHLKTSPIVAQKYASNSASHTSIKLCFPHSASHFPPSSAFDTRKYSGKPKTFKNEHKNDLDDKAKNLYEASKHYNPVIERESFQSAAHFDQHKPEDRSDEAKADDNDDDDGYGSTLLDYYINKAKEDIEYMDDVDYHDIQDVNQRVFYKIVDMWLKEVGSTKRGHRDFIKTLLDSLPKFNVESEISAYLKLFDCFPVGKHTGIKRDHWFKAGFQDKLADHALGIKIITKIQEWKAVPNDKLFNITTDLFGRFSPVTWTARATIFWYPKLLNPNPHPLTVSEFKKLTPIEIAFKGLRQMNPGLDCHYHYFAVDKSRCEETLAADKIDSVLSVQTDDQIKLLANHDPSTPVYVEGPFTTYCMTKTVQYFVMRSDPKELEVKKPRARIRLLTTKEWWVQFYETDWKTGRTPAEKIEENFFPVINLPKGDSIDLLDKEIVVVEKDTESVEGPVYAIACTDYTNQEALLTWIRGLSEQNPILTQCTVLIREEEAFLLNAPKTDPNESFYETVELPPPF